jgi:uncharacterized membrane protein YeiH
VVTEPASLPSALIALMYFGDMVFAFSGALVAGRHRMDLLGIVLIGIVTGIGGGTLRDVLLGNPVWWVHNPLELVLCATTAFAAYFIKGVPGGREDAAAWADAIGLSAFAVVGAHIALAAGASAVTAAFLGMVTATGGGLLRDLLTQTRPMILSSDLYATAALVGAAAYVMLSRYVLASELSAFASCALAFAVRAAAMKFHIRFGVMGEPIVMMRRKSGPADKE